MAILNKAREIESLQKIIEDEMKAFKDSLKSAMENNGVEKAEIVYQLIQLSSLHCPRNVITPYKAALLKFLEVSAHVASALLADA